MGFIKLFFMIFSSFFIFWFPKSLNKLFFGNIDFVFVANIRDHNDLTRKTFLEGLLSNLYVRCFKYKWPFIVSKIEGVYSKEGNPIRGCAIICPFTAKELVEDRRKGSRAVLKAVKLAQKINAKSVNLAAFTSIVTGDGYWLQNKVNISITTGNTFSAVIAIENIQKAVDLIGLDMKDITVAVVGAAGSVGSGCVKYLADKVKELVLIDLKVHELEQMKRELSVKDLIISVSNQVENIKNADVVISATSALGRIIKQEYVKLGAIIIDASHPRNVSRDLIKNRKDVLVIYSAIARVKGLKCNFDFGLGEEEVFGCLGESVIVGWLGEAQKDYLGKVDLEFMKRLKKYSKQAGVELAPFRNALGYIDEDKINFIKILRNQV